MTNQTATSSFSRRAFVRAVLLGGAIIGVGACSSPSGGQASISPTVAPAAGAPAPTAGSRASAVKTGGMLTVAYGLNPSSLDPHLGNSGGDAFYWRAMFDTLVGLDQQYQPTPELSLAQSWETPDDHTIVFHLRPNVTLHDGSPLDSDLIKWNMQRVLDPQLQSTAAASFSALDHVETPDSMTARFVLKSPDSALLALLGDRGGAIISRKAAEQYGDQFGSHPVGSGPFVFEQWVPNGSVSMKRNSTYWRKDTQGTPLPYLDGVKMQIIPDPTAALAAVNAGQAQLSGINAKDVAQVQANPSLTLLRFDGASIASVLVFNTDKPAVQDVRVRQAICYALNPAAVNKAVYFDQNTVALAGMWPINTWVYQPITDRPKYDPNKAKQLLQDAGQSGAVNVQMITWPDDPSQLQQATAYQAQLKDVGITADIQQFSVGVATANFFKNGMGDIFSTGWSRYPEPDWIASNNFNASAYYNPMKKPFDPQVQPLIEQGRESFDQAKRKDIYNRLSQIVVNQGFYVPMIYGTGLVAATKSLQGTDTLFSGDAKWSFTQLWLGA
jgi:ABC-type transport system substrate-binding protein